MPLYFAYGSNMHAAGFAARCPRSRALGRAMLADHRFYLMRSSGYASVRPAAGEAVYGLLIDLDPSDLAALDDYEDVEGGLYTRAEHGLSRAEGGTAAAIVYLGGEGDEGGVPPPGYMECVVAAARAAELPAPYLAALAALLPPAEPGRAGVPW